MNPSGDLAPHFDENCTQDWNSQARSGPRPRPRPRMSSHKTKTKTGHPWAPLDRSTAFQNELFAQFGLTIPKFNQPTTNNNNKNDNHQPLGAFINSQPIAKRVLLTAHKPQIKATESPNMIIFKEIYFSLGLSTCNHTST